MRLPPEAYDSAVRDIRADFVRAPDEVARKAAEFSRVGDIKGLEGVLDSGILQNKLSEQMVFAIHPLIKSVGYATHPELFRRWIDQCAQSNGAATAKLVWEMIKNEYIDAEDLAPLISLWLEADVALEEVGALTSNRGALYRLNRASLPSVMALKYPARFETIVQGEGWPGKLTSIPYGGRITEDPLGAPKEHDLNIVELLLLGNCPNDPDMAADRVRKVVDCLDLTAPTVKAQLADSLLRAHSLGWLAPNGSADPIDWVVLLIDAGCELKPELLALCVAPDEQDSPDSLLNAICGCSGRSNDNVPTGSQFAAAAARLIAEAGIDPNEHGPGGATALLRVVEKDNVSMVKMLLEHGADPAITYRGNETMDAVGLAQSLGHAEIESVLQAWAAQQAVARVITARRPAQHGTQKGGA